MKQEAWKLWHIEERFDLEFDEEQAICYGCKELDKPEGIVLQALHRQGVRPRKKSSTAASSVTSLLPATRTSGALPKFKEQVVEMQVKYRQQT